MNWSRLTVLSVSFLIALQAVRAQTPPAFEVASVKQHPIEHGIIVKPWTPTFQCDPKLHCGITGDRFREVMVSLADLIVDAYKVKKFQIIGLPSWGDSGAEVYDVEAKAPAGTTPTPDQARLMLRTLLDDRFGLRLHHETRILPVYALVVSAKGLKLIPNQKACGSSRAKGRSGPSVDPETEEPTLAWPFYAQVLTIWADRPIVDESGLNGGDYCTMDGRSPTAAIASAVYSGTGDNRASIFTAVEEAWGMKLESKKAEVDVLVVEKAERPSMN